MSRVIMLLPLGDSVGIKTITLGLIQAIQQQNLNITFFQPISNNVISNNCLDTILNAIKDDKSINIIPSIKKIILKNIYDRNQYTCMMDKIFEYYNLNIGISDVILINGLTVKNTNPFINKINYEIACNLNAEIIFVSVLQNHKYFNLKQELKMIHNFYGIDKNLNIIGIIVNQINQCSTIKNNTNDFTVDNYFNIVPFNHYDINSFIKNSNIKLLAHIPLNMQLIRISVMNLLKYLKLDIIHDNSTSLCIIQFIFLLECYASDILKNLKHNSLVIISFYNIVVLKNLLHDFQTHLKISLLVITNVNLSEFSSQNWIQQIKKTCLSVIITPQNTLNFLFDLKKVHFKTKDTQSLFFDAEKKIIANYIDKDWVKSLKQPVVKNNSYLSPIEFRYHLRMLAKKSLFKKIVLPEGHEPRIIKAAIFCYKNNIADCILLGDRKNIYNIASKNNIQLDEKIKILNPNIISKNYIDLLIKLRQHKGMNKIIANKQIKNNIILGTLMLQNGDVDGLVAGSVTTTAESIRPGLQLIKMDKKYSLVSSAFFMLLPNRVCIYADCAINADPDYKQLSEIAIQSAETAILFGIEPRIAMISYSTGQSGFGDKVKIVNQATVLLKEKYPNLVVDGPMQYDTAMTLDIAKIKLPNSKVAGKANILIFPDLNTGNTTYKAVQRSANIMCIGPMLQGLKKPINDLSRGASIEDIIYTIALTVVQSSSLDKNKI
ncbi:Phosphate acetyltransferase [Buchnera aphidicola (Eriosoma grossulariae)]|uniref:phosphate acetyltransferase n=1 Tax=Buchnera aphidicola TaxID=9 RepID=UPI0034644F72